MHTSIPEGYKSLLTIYDTQKAISLLHRLFEDRLGALLNLYRVSAPLFVEENSGLNDNLPGPQALRLLPRQGPVYRYERYPPGRG